MNYVLLIYLNTNRWGLLSQEERNRVHADCGTWHDELVKSGHTRGAMGLQPVSTATTLSDQDGEVVITDGPFAETKEVLGGFEHVECSSLDEAIAIAKRFPALRVGSLVEVRPIVTGGACRD
ncbi:MAG: YciI family protein [Opitutaceae bacterium]